MSLFPGSRQLLIGMIHVRALPGSPSGRDSVSAVVAAAAREARILRDAGFGALMIENMHDVPYVHAEHSPEIVACMTRVGLAVRDAAPELPFGVQVLSGGNREAIAVAHAVAEAPRAVPAFIRCENFVFSHVADEGLLPRAEAGPLLRYRRRIGADRVSVLCDIKKKHASHALTADISIAQTARAAEFFRADGVIVTGSATGQPVSIDDLRDVRSATSLPVLVGSGATPDNIAALLEHADAVIVGSSIKKAGLWSNPLDPRRCRALVKAFRSGART
ncbi:MAG: BtpA/SgcQ family protein [Phycisphaerales bacterium]